MRSEGYSSRSVCQYVCVFVYDYSRTTGYEAAYERHIVCDRWVLRAHTAAHDVAMELRSSGIDARTYLCRAPLDRIDVRTPQC